MKRVHPVDVRACRPTPTLSCALRAIVAVHRHPTTGALLPLATIEFSEPVAAVAAVRAANSFDGPLRALGPKLVVNLDPSGSIARQLRDNAHGLGGSPQLQQQQLHLQQLQQLQQ